MPKAAGDEEGLDSNETREDARSSPHERRQAPRLRFETEVDFQGPTNFFVGFTEDISCGGLFVATYNLQPLGTLIQLRFRLPEGPPLEVRGRVRWLRDPRNETLDAPPGMGIVFESLSTDAERSIRQFLAARAPIFFDD